MNILMVEDDAATARTLTLLLQSAGFQTYCVDLGERAWIWARSMTST